MDTLVAVLLDALTKFVTTFQLQDSRTLDAANRVYGMFNQLSRGHSMRTFAYYITALGNAGKTEQAQAIFDGLPKGLESSELVRQLVLCFRLG